MDPPTNLHFNQQKLNNTNLFLTQHYILIQPQAQSPVHHHYLQPIILSYLPESTTQHTLHDNKLQSISNPPLHIS